PRQDVSWRPIASCERPLASVVVLAAPRGARRRGPSLAIADLPAALERAALGGRPLEPIGLRRGLLAQRPGLVLELGLQDRDPRLQLLPLALEGPPPAGERLRALQ